MGAIGVCGNHTAMVACAPSFFLLCHNHNHHHHHHHHHHHPPLLAVVREGRRGLDPDGFACLFLRDTTCSMYVRQDEEASAEEGERIFFCVACRLEHMNHFAPA